MGSSPSGALETLKSQREGRAQGHWQVQDNGSKGSRPYLGIAGPLGTIGNLSDTWPPGRGSKAAERGAVGRALLLISLLGA